MNYSNAYLLMTVSALTLCGCRSTNSEDEVVSERYIHKYGYAVSKEDWNSREYPGQVISQKKDGVTVTATYEGGLLHGPTTHTFPHSQTVEQFYLYNQGAKVKEICYNLEGMPVQEIVQLSPSRYAVTRWYRTGSPLSVEEFVANELLDGQYFSATNEIESRIDKGNGVRIQRNIEGLLLAKEEFIQGALVKRETFHPNGLPSSIAHYYQGKLHGEKSVFGLQGEPISVEEYIGDELHGNASYFNHGVKYKDVSYLYGQKNGVEKHYIDGSILAEEIAWENDLQHGCQRIYHEGGIDERWFYAGDSVSIKKFNELNRLDAIISQISID